MAPTHGAGGSRSDTERAERAWKHLDGALVQHDAHQEPAVTVNGGCYPWRLHGGLPSEVPSGHIHEPWMRRGTPQHTTQLHVTPCANNQSSQTRLCSTPEPPGSWACPPVPVSASGAAATTCASHRGEGLGWTSWTDERVLRWLDVHTQFARAWPGGSRRKPLGMAWILGWKLVPKTEEGLRPCGAMLAVFIAVSTLLHF